MPDPTWNLRPLAFNEEEQGISEWDQFDKERRQIDETLLREAVQNSLDARLQDREEAVKVRLAWCSANDGRSRFLSELTRPLEPHLKMAGREATSNGGVAALVVEDFGTQGLTGKIDDPVDDGNFRTFFFRHSSSRKVKGSRGRWGLGKLVFAAMSGCSCFFALTRRADDHKTLVMGKAAIGSRTQQGHAYPAFARWCKLDESDREMPVEDPELIERFATEFELERGQSSGLSVIVPFPRIALDETKLIDTVLREWAVPILRGRLVIAVQGTKVDANYVRGEGVRKLGAEVLAFLEDVACGGTGAVSLPECCWELGNSLNEETLGPDLLAELRKRYVNGEIVQVRYPVRVTPKSFGGSRTTDQFGLWLQKLDSEGPRLALRLRGDITIPDAAPLDEPGVLSALVAEDGPLAEFLADAEPPAHDTWQRTQRLQAKWRHAQETLSLIRTAPKKLHRLLSSEPQETLPDALLDLFWFEDPGVTGPVAGSSGSKGKPHGRGAVEPPRPTPTARRLAIEPRPGGFRLKAGEGLAATGLPCRVRVKVAYDVEEGDPIAAWSPLDFDLSRDEDAIAIDLSGGEVVERQGNELLIEVDDAEFTMEVTGFDFNRDLDVRAHILRGMGA